VACGVAGTDERLPFEVLRDYPCAVWFTKYGVFSHVTRGIDNAMLDAMAKICLEADLPDWHYDVIALPPDSRVSLTRLASTGSLDQSHSRETSVRGRRVRPCRAVVAGRALDANRLGAARDSPPPSNVPRNVDRRGFRRVRHGAGPAAARARRCIAIAA
jgi:hypothetical protein